MGKLHEIFIKMSIEKKSFERLYYLAKQYAERYEPLKEPENLFEEFEKKVKIHTDFIQYLKTQPMKRQRKSLQKRKLFIEWFYWHYRGKKRVMNTLAEAAELAFISESTAENDLRKKNLE